MNFEQPNAVQKAWRELVRANGCILSRYPHGITIHHVLGRTAKIKGIGNIGHAWILPLEHNSHLWVDWGAEGLRLMKEKFIHGHGDSQADVIDDLTLMEFQKFLFAKVCEFVPPPFDDDVLEAIQGWHR